MPARAFVVNSEAAIKRHLALVADDVLDDAAETALHCPHCGSTAWEPDCRAITDDDEARSRLTITGHSCGNCGHFQPEQNDE